MMNTERLSVLFRQILSESGFDLTDPNMVDTPTRMANTFKEFLYGHTEDAQTELTQLVQKTFPSHLDEMITIRQIQAVGICPHHFLPVTYKIDVGYIPNASKCIGLSKIPRIVRILASRAVMQETLCADIAQFLMDNLNPQGVAAHVVGVHTCMSLRGVKETNADMVTTALLGCLRDHTSKQEFLQSLR